MEGLLLGSIWHYFFSVFFWWANLTFFEFLIFVCASYLLGNLILKFLRIDFQHPGEHAVYSIMLGYGGFAARAPGYAVRPFINPALFIAGF